MQRKIDRQTYILMILLALLVLGGVGAGIYFANQDIDGLRETVMQFLKRARATHWSFPLTVGVYIAAALIVFPITVLNLASSMVFGPFWGFVYGVCGSLAAATALFSIGAIGRRFGLKSLFSGKRASQVDKKLENSGVAGIAMLGFVPIAPFSLFSLCAGLSSVHYTQFIAGVFLALLPGGIARSVLGDSLMKIFLDPNPQTLAYVGAGLVFWICMLGAVHFGLKKYNQKHGSENAAA